MICYFQFDSWTNAVVAQMNVRLEVKRVGIYGQIRAKPSKEWADVAPVRNIVVVLPNEKVVFLKRYPHAPSEYVFDSMNREFQTAVNEVEAVSDNATVRGEEYIRITLALWNVPIRSRSIRVKR